MGNRVKALKQESVLRQAIPTRRVRIRAKDLPPSSMGGTSLRLSFQGKTRPPLTSCTGI
jgi:hypothetical protein